MLTQLNPMLPVHVLGRGDGYAMAIIDYGQEHNLIWVTSITSTGEIWCAPNPSVRMAKNWTMGRPGRPSKPDLQETVGSKTDIESLTKAISEMTQTV